MIRVVVYTSEPLTSMGLAVLFRSCEDIELVATIASASELTERLSLDCPDVLLLSVDATVPWTLLDQLRAAQNVGATFADIKVVFWVHEITPELAYQAMSSGVRGILRKTLPPDLIPKCVRKVSEGELWFEKSLTQTFLSGRTVKVSRREAQLITLTAQGLKNKEIASVMAISEGTVKVYLSRLFEKVGVRDRFELALFGLRSMGPGMDAAGSTAYVQECVAMADEPRPKIHGVAGRHHSRFLVERVE